MRIPLPLAWVMLGMTFITAALLRQFHDRTPTSPHLAPVVGSLLFAVIFILLLVSAWESRRGAVSGPGVRLGSLAPLMLMLFVEKWVSLSIYPPLFNWIAPKDLDPRFLDAVFRTFAGVCLIAVCLVIGRLSRPTMRKTWRRARPIRWPAAALGTLLVVAGSYVVLGGLNMALGGGLHLKFPRSSPLLVWVIASQGILAFAEELYYRGLLLCEMERLTPRLGIGSAALRRWIALGFTAALFGFEHMQVGPPWGQALREMIFVFSLGLLFGILVMLSTNLHFVGGVHAWINWLLLGAAPVLATAAAVPALPAGTYIGVALILSFVLTFAYRKWRVTSREAIPCPDRP